VFERWVREPEGASSYAKAAGTVAGDKHPSSLEEGGYTTICEAQRMDRQHVHLYSEVGLSGTGVFTIEDDDSDEEDLESSDTHSHT